MLVVALQSQDRYITLVLASITVWIVGQAFVNIGVVVGLFPVMGCHCRLCPRAVRR
ncbi:MAG: FtsW/RodA/SpoVE family cell cycle protein [Bifidobacterium sp.]